MAIRTARAKPVLAAMLLMLLSSPGGLALGAEDPLAPRSSPGPTAFCQTEGPDSYGYVCRQESLAFATIRDTGTRLSLSDDGFSHAVPIGFPFNFYGTTYNNVYVGSNGWVSFRPPDGFGGCCSGQPLPDAAMPNGLIAGYWEDLYPPGGGVIAYQTRGPAGFRDFVVEFNAVPHYPSGNPVTFQVILRQCCADMFVEMFNMPSDGGTHVTGIENYDGTVGLRYNYGSYGVSGLAVRFLRTVTAPRSLSASAGPGAGEISLTWDTPESDGGAPITNYKIYRRSFDCSGGFAHIATWPSSPRSYTDTGLSEGTTYCYRLSAVNGYGIEGPLSGPASAVTFARPGPPQSLSASSGPGRGQINLGWQAPSSEGGTPVTAYHLYRGTSAGGPYGRIATLGSGARSYTDSGLPDGTYFYYRATAENAVGEGPWSNEASARTFSRPSEPRFLSASPGPGLLEVRLSWGAPLDTGGASILHYVILRSDGNPGNYRAVGQGGGNLQFTDRGLSPGRTYYYKAVAVNIVGAGPESNEACAKPFPWAPFPELQFCTISLARSPSEGAPRPALDV